jgi:membrane protein
MQIPGLREIGPVALLKESAGRFRDHDMATYAAALTYHILFSLFPFTMFLIALLGFLELSIFFDWLRERAQAFFLEDTMQQVDQILGQLQERRRGLLSFGVIIALWAATSAFRASAHALNVIYCVKETRPPWKRYPRAIVYTILVGAMLVLAAAMVLISPQAMQWLLRQAGLEQSVIAAWAWPLRWPAIVLLLTLAVAVVYHAAPDVEQRFRFITPGAFIAVLAWITASLGFHYYVRNVANFHAMYGSVGTAIVLLLYFFISSIVLLFGAEMNAVVEHHAPTGKNPGEKRLRR